MDLSQQELPLTAYFIRGSQEARSRSMTYKKKRKEEKEKPAADLHPVTRCAKRRKSDVQYSTTSPPGCSAGRSESRKTIMQLPTPVTSTRKRKRNGHLEVPTKTRAAAACTVLSSVEQSAIPQDEEDLSQLELGPTPSKFPQVSRNGAVLLATPSTDRRRTTKSTGIGLHPGSRHSDRGETGVDCSPLARSECRFPSIPTPASPRSLDSEVPRASLPRVQYSARSTAGRPCVPVDSDCLDPFYTREKNSSFVRQDSAFALPDQCLVQSKTLDSQPSDGHALPMIPIPSSQSQYLLRLDATPKRRQYSRNTETVISSQTQEERELTLSTSHRPTAIINISPGKHTHGNALIPRLSCNKRKNQHIYTLGSTPVGSPTSSPACTSHSFFATKKALDELSPKSSSPSRRKKLTSHHSPSRKTKTPQRFRRDSIENIPPAYIEDSLTESESESDILRTRMKDGLPMLGPPMNQIPRHVPVAPDACPPVHRGLVKDNLHGVEDDSVTEAESDTEILHCVAEIGKNRFCDHHSPVAKEDTPPPPVISPLVSPARSRIATMPSIIGSTQFCTQEDPSTMERSQMLSESLPSVVRDFLRMFPGDESYPPDFPESLRI